MRIIEDVIDWIQWHALEILLGVVIAIGAAAISLSIYFVVANENNKISEGVIVDKTYSDTQAIVTYHNGPNNSMIPSTRIRPETFEFTIKGVKGGEEVEYSFKVTEEEYNSFKIGDYYVR